MSGWITGHCSANGTRLHFVRTGGNKPPVVLLHGLTGSGACWTPLARALENDYDVVMPDARGHSGSRGAADDTPYRYDLLAADVIGLIDAMELGTPFLLGHSMGGMTAAVVASQNPGRLQGLILVDPTFLSPQRQREVYDSDAAEQHRKTLRLSKQQLVAELRGRGDGRSLELIELIAQARLRTDMRTWDILTPPNPDYTQLVEALDLPALLVIGDRGVVAREVASDLARLNPRLRIEELSDAGHGIPYDLPDRLATVVRSFLDARA